MMDRVGGTSNPLFDANDDQQEYDERDYFSKGQFFIAQQALRQETQALGDALGDRIDRLAIDLRNSEARQSDQIQEIRDLLTKRASSSTTSSRRRHSSRYSSSTPSDASPPRARSPPRRDQDRQDRRNPLHGKNLQGRIQERECSTAKIMKSVDKTRHIIPEVTPKMKRFVKHNVGVSAKQMKLKKLSVKPLVPSMNATGFEMNESKSVVEQYKMKPHTTKSNKNDETGQDNLVNNVNSIMRTKMMWHQDMNAVTTVTKMMNNALASSSSQCQSSPEAPIPKNISLGH
jgi:hypothetical protein